MADPNEPLLETCHACGALIDISDAEPLALLHCPACGAGMRVRKTFDNFELQEVLGAGGMGAVYRAYDKNLNRSVALKLLRREYGEDEEFVAQFQNEASITASINHPNVVKVYSAGNDHGRIYIAMELVDKGSLDDLMTLQTRVAEAQVLEVGIQIAEGLNAALQRGLIHRDIKPGNILFSNAHTAKIVDFGLAVLQEHAGKVAGEVWGTPYYVAPEKLDNQPEDFRSDIYSLGGTLFHAVAGRPPFEAETASMVALKHVKSQVVSLQAFAPGVSSATAFVINKALHKDPNQRYQSYGELIEHLKYARTELLTSGRKPTPRARIALEREKERRVMSWFTFSMVALVVVGGVLAFTMRDRLFGTTNNNSAQIEEMRRRTAELQPAYTLARAEMIGGNFRDAARTFQSLAADSTTPQPLLNWFNLQAALAMLFNGDLNGARQEFGRIEARKMFSQEPADRRLARFFLELSKAVRTEGEAQNVKPKGFDASNYESIGPLVLGLKAWNEARIDDAGVLLNQFKSSTPQPPYEWIVEYKKILNPYHHDLALYRKVTQALKGET
ncbi:MAG: protein kinase, partial [Chthoniobacteraceae bacterium]